MDFSQKNMEFCQLRFKRIVRVLLKSIEPNRQAPALLTDDRLLVSAGFPLIFHTGQLRVSDALLWGARARLSQLILENRIPVSLYLSSRRNNGVAGLGTVVAN